MKNRVVAGLTVLMLACSLVVAGCSSDDSEDSQDALIGRWTWAKLTIRGVTLDLSNPNGYVPGGSTTITPAWIDQLLPGTVVNLTVTFNEDKTASGSLNATIPNYPPISGALTGTWKTSGDTLTLTVSNQGTSYTVAGTYDVAGRRLTIAMTNSQLLNALGTNDVDLSALTPDQQQLVRSLSGSLEFTK